MKHRITLLLIATLVLCGTAMQASAQRMMLSPEERTKQLTDSLGLNKDQSAKALKIHQDADKKRQELFNSGSDDREAMRESMRSLMDTMDKDIEALLTAKQKKKYEEMKSQRMQRRPNRQPRQEPSQRQ